ncbi:MAG: hypothetical protein HC893_02640 [Chloroflexaceae bacterium]|nr:hypothetical protein [Chloroflexaceae bacterium]
MIHAVVIANAPDLDATPFIGLLRQADLIVAADGGANALHRVNIVPHVVIGDLDSLEQNDRAVAAALRAPRCGRYSAVAPREGRNRSPGGLVTGCGSRGYAPPPAWYNGWTA